MQLTSKSNATGKTKKVANVNTALAAATCVLLGTIPVVQAMKVFGKWILLCCITVKLIESPQLKAYFQLKKILAMSTFFLEKSFFDIK